MGANGWQLLLKNSKNLKDIMKQNIPDNVFNLFPIILVFYEIANYLSNDAYLPALPAIAESLNAGNHLVQLTLTLFFLGNATMQLILGPLSDRYGRRIILLGGGVVFIVTTLICGFSKSINLFLLARFFQGASVTSMIVSGYATIHAMYEQTKAVRTLAWMNSITVLAPALGPLFGAFVLMFGSWRLIFFLLSIWAMIGLIGLYRLMPETCDKAIDMDVKKILLSYWRTIINLRFLMPACAMSLLFAAMIAWIAAGPFLVMETFGYNSLVFGLLQAFVFGSFIVGTRVVSYLIERVDMQRISVISAGIAFLGAILGLMMSYLVKDHLIDVVLPMMIVAYGAGIGFPVFNRLAIEGSNEPMGITMAIFASFMGSAGLLGSVLISTFYTAHLVTFALIIFLLCAAGMICAWKILS
jgi:MFS transporter, DHA1 family, multidrug resistance protein